MTNDVELVDLGAKVAFDESGYAKIDVAASDRILLGLNTFRPGQRQPVHAHADQDKFYLVLSGRARFTLDGKPREAGEQGVVWVPAGVEHGVENRSDDPLVLLVGMAPAPGG